MSAFEDINALTALGCSEIKLRSASDECFPGQYFDSETGLHYNYFRDYDPSLGRCIQSDPIGLDGGLNIFGYALQNPILNTDPQGLHSYGSHQGVDYPHFDEDVEGECLSADCVAFPETHNDARPNKSIGEIIDLSDANQCVLDCMARLSALACYAVSGGTLILSRSGKVGAVAGAACQTFRFRMCVEHCEDDLQCD